jgi:hypothetical protein
MNPKHLTFNTVAFFAAAKKVSAAGPIRDFVGEAYHER